MTPLGSAPLGVGPLGATIGKRQLVFAAEGLGPTSTISPAVAKVDLLAAASSLGPTSIIAAAESAQTWVPRPLRAFALPVGPTSVIAMPSMALPFVATSIGPDSRFGKAKAVIGKTTCQASAVGPTSTISQASGNSITRYPASPVGPSSVIGAASAKSGLIAQAASIGPSSIIPAAMMVKQVVGKPVSDAVVVFSREQQITVRM